VGNTLPEKTVVLGLKAITNIVSIICVYMCYLFLFLRDLFVEGTQRFCWYINY